MSCQVDSIAYGYAMGGCIFTSLIVYNIFYQKIHRYRIYEELERICRERIIVYESDSSNSEEDPS